MTRRTFEFALVLAVAALVSSCSETSVVPLSRIVGRYSLPYPTQPTALAVGLGSLWIVVPAAKGAPAGQLAYGSLVRIALASGKRQGPTSSVGGFPVDVALAKSSIWVANEPGDPSQHFAYQSTVLDLAASSGTVIRRYSGQDLVGGSLETSLAGDGAGIWDIVSSSSLSTSRTKVLSLLGPTAEPISTVGGFPASVAGCNSSLYVATWLISTGRTRVYRLSPTSGAIESTWTINLSALATLDCLPGGVLLGLSSPRGGGLFRLENHSARVPPAFGTRTQSGTAVVGDDVWTLTARQSVGGDWSTWLDGYSWRTRRSVTHPLRLGRTGDVLGPIAPAALSASGHDVWAVVGRQLLKVAI